MAACSGSRASSAAAAACGVVVKDVAGSADDAGEFVRTTGAA